MIQWKLYINSIEESSCNTLLHGAKIEIKETDKLVFVVNMDSDEFATWGTPTIMIGDIPLTMVLNENFVGSNYNFISSEPIYSHRARYFYNFFGESEVNLCFDNSPDETTCINFDILARKENADLANDMLSFLTENIEDAIAICFSRSKRGADLIGEDGHSFNKIDVIINAIEFFSVSITKFIRDSKSVFYSEVILADNGQPTGPDSIYWALTNLDKLSPASQDSVNIYFNNRGYHYEQLPKEVIKRNFDIYENRVINSFLLNAESFLYSLKQEYVIHNIPSAPINSEYVRFDHTMAKFSKMALDVKIKEIESLIIKLKEIRSLYLKVIPSKYNMIVPPRISSYVAKKNHYREAFQLIEKYYRSQAPDFSNNRMLLGLKNLSIIYELTTLVMLHKSIESVFNTNIKTQNYRYHAESNPFGGVDSERPNGVINNHFIFSSSDYHIELLYEAKIYPYNVNSRLGDLIDTSNTYGSTKYGKHHFCPDFILKISSKRWSKNLTVILDAKFKDIETIRDYDMSPLTNRYLLNIHLVGNNGKIHISPVDMLILLFAHDKNGKILRTVAPKHCITGQYPILPQSTAIAYNPNETSILNEHLAGLKNFFNSI